ncbi:MAG TPA: hypothetical protein VGI19_07880 [Candidatus Cybelea sp.]
MRQAQVALNYNALYVEVLSGKADFEGTPSGVPCYTALGWRCWKKRTGLSTGSATTIRAKTA